MAPYGGAVSVGAWRHRGEEAAGGGRRKRRQVVWTVGWLEGGGEASSLGPGRRNDRRILDESNAAEVFQYTSWDGQEYAAVGNAFLADSGFEGAGDRWPEVLVKPRVPQATLFRVTTIGIMARAV